MSTEATATGSASRLRPGHALGVFFVALATLMLEITLTRLFSVTIWYHFGALAVSLAMFGVGASGVAVYVLPGVFRPGRMERDLPLLCALFAVSIAVSLFLMLGIVFIPRFSLAAIGTLALLYLVTVVPFFLSGLCIALIFAHRPHQIGRLYFMDLLGAGLGCMVAVGAMFALSAPDVVLLAALFAGVGSICFAAAGGRLTGPLAVTVGLAALLAADLRTGVFRIDFIKGVPARALDFERWTPYAYVGVGEVQRDRRPFAWGLSAAWSGPGPPERTLKIDEGAATTITDYGGDLRNVEYLRYDVTSIGHYIFDGHKVLIIGAGGGRDILAALAFGADTVHALEYNAAVVEAVNGAFGDFSGRVYDLPKVRPIVEEGRSYIQRTSETYDFIQASLVDSWAANASGAYVMAENFLYTKEAFAAFLDRLTERGVLSVSRFNLPQTPQITRTVSLAMAVLADRGVTRPGDHMLVVTAEGGKVGTLLVARRPLAPEAVQALAREAERLQFDVEWAPGIGGGGEVAALLGAADPARFLAEHPFDLSPPTDDRPFFFHMANSPRAWRHVSAAIEQKARAAGTFNLKWYGTFVLVAVLVIATVMALLCILTPLYTFKRADLAGVSGKGAFLGYFTCLGIGFMLVEIPLMQRFTLFLGHPVYSLSVVLFALLVWAGCGSLLSSRLRSARPEVSLRRVLLLLFFVLAVYNFLVPLFLSRFIVQPVPVRIALAAACLLPLGLVLGMPLPLGMRVVERNAVRLVPWMWGINGASSVLASLLALAMAMSVGLSATMLAGQAIYAIALLLALAFRTARAGAPGTVPGGSPA